MNDSNWSSGMGWGMWVIPPVVIIIIVIIVLKRNRNSK
ncbi:hypothetical protein SAMN05443669_100848 [Flavobacterium xanthum]|uniref:Uncharacterized protein n=1 Tax=Flavobacterium xanthum TaxID=69322 RepID=A0A1M7B2N1_9FLAO|nr:hypothetical protein SAMN05443669_100848 [Flavobacterium xanthum]